MANIITGVRMIFAVALLFCPAFSPAFYVLYVAAGTSDMIDGAVARKTGAASEAGARLDTLADFIFVAVCLAKLLPVLRVPAWLAVWIVAIAVIKAAGLAVGYVVRKEIVVLHTVMNKVTGILLFILPLTFAFIDIRYSGAAVCAVATFAALQEGHRINKQLPHN